MRIPEKVFDNCYADRKSDIHLANKVVQLDFRNPPLNLNLLRKCFEGNKQIILEFNSWFAQNQDLFKNNNAIANEIRDAVLETGEDKNSIEFFKDPEVIVKILCQNIEKLKQHWQNEIHFYIFSSEKKAIDTIDTILKQSPINKKFLLTNQNNMNISNSSSTSSSSSSSSSTSAPLSTASLSPGVNHSCPTDASTPQNSSSAEASEYDEEIPEAYLCPITGEAMTDPVIIKNGYTFERKAIAEWLSKSKTCPITRENINPDDEMRPNRALKDSITAWEEKHKSKKPKSTSSALSTSSTSSYINSTTTPTQTNNSYPSSSSNYMNYTGASGPGNSRHISWTSSSQQPQPNPQQNNDHSEPHSSFGPKN